MIIILEGPDGSGKTTLAKQLVESGFKYHHEGPPRNPDMLFVYGSKLKEIYDAGGNWVLDRFHLGENVYGPLVRGKSLLGGEEGLRVMNRLIRAVGATVVICLPDYETCRENWRANHKLEYLKDEEKYRKVWQAYFTFVLSGEYKLFNYRINTIQQLVANLDFPNVVPFRGKLIGNPRAKFLFVGEKSNWKTLDLPFFSQAGSSSYLNNALWDAGYQEHEMAFVNALDLNRRPNPTLVAAKLYFPAIIACGEVAAKYCPHHVKIAHPAYWKRFHSKSREVYVEQLRDIRNRFSKLS